MSNNSTTEIVYNFVILNEGKESYENVYLYETQYIECEVPWGR